MPVHRQRTFELPDSEVGTVVWAARQHSGVDLRSASELAGIDWRVLSRIERGERPCRVTEMVALAEAYRVSPDLLMRAVIGDERARRKIGLESEEVRVD